MVCVAQLVRASDCDSEGHRFDPDRAPHLNLRIIKQVPVAQ